MLRKILCLHPVLACPEETHFFRWAEPFGTARYEAIYKQNKTILQHQEMDGISGDEFMELYRTSLDRRELMDAYMSLYLRRQGKPDARWFDKTPQHVYGLLLLKKMYPEAKVIHIYRNPLNVVASLLKGQVMPQQTLIGAINYWNEAMYMMEGFRKLHPESVLDVCYENFCSATGEGLAQIFAFIGEEMAFELPGDYVHRERNQYKSVMNKEQIRLVQERCAEHMEKFGYNDKKGWLFW